MITRFSGLSAIIAGEVRRAAIERMRYIGDTVSSILTIYIVFLVVFYGFRGLAGPELPEARLEVLLLVYLSWLFALTALQTFADEVSQEMQRGTLEQLYLSPYGVWTILIVRAFVELLWSFVLVGVILFLIMWTTGVWVPVLNIRALGPLLIAIPGLWGVGIAFGGLILINKRAQGLLQILNFGLIGLVAVDAYPLGVASFLPFAAGSSTMRAVLLSDALPSASWLAFLAAVSAAYLLFGAVVYRVFEGIAKRRNLLGQY